MFLDVNVDANKLVEQLQNIATPAVQEVLRVYIHQQIVNGYIGLGTSALLFVVAVASLVVFIKNYRKWALTSSKLEALKWHSDERAMLVEIGQDTEPWLWLSASCATVFFFICIWALIIALQALLNPEYWAIQDLLTNLHK